MEKPYAVVRFVDEKSYSEIPTNWILKDDESNGENMCRWPPQFIKNVNFRIKNRLTPSDSWPSHAIEIIGYYDTLSEARKAAEESENSSATDKPLGWGKRAKKPTAAMLAAAKSSQNKDPESCSDEDYSDKAMKPAAAMPSFNSKNVTPKTSSVPRTFAYRSDNTNNRECNISKDSNGHSRKDNSTSSEKLNNNKEITKTFSDSESSETLAKKNSPKVSATVEINDDDPHDLRFNILNDKLDGCLNLLGAISVEVKDVKQRLMANSGQTCNNVNAEIFVKIKNDLPLQTRTAVSDFDAKLSTSKDYQEAFIKIIKQVGGANGEEYIRRVLNTIFSPLFAKDNTWEGKITKYKINNLKIIKTCEEVILQKFPAWDSAEFAKAGTNWFRLGNQRAGGQKGQVAKKNQNESNEQ